MPLTSEEIAALVAEMSACLEAARVDAVHQMDEHSVVLTFRSSGSDKRFLLLSTRPRLSRFHFLPERPRAPPEPPAFCGQARRHLEGARVRGVRQVSGDRVLEISFERPAIAGSRRGPISLVLEMIGGRGQLVIVGEGRELLATLHPFRRGSKALAPGDPYRFPEPRAQPPQVKPFASTPWRYLEPDPASPEGCPVALHHALARHYARLEAEQVFRERQTALCASLRREVERRESAIAKVRQDLAQAEGGEDLRRKGDLLKGAMARVRRGMPWIELEDYFDPALATVRVELDPALGPRENVERYFKRYQKSKRAVAFLRERASRLEGEREAAAGLLRAAEAARALEEVLEVEERAKGLVAKRAPARPKGPSQARAAGPRRYASADGFEILVGRNARQNDALTLRLARGNDLFFHVAGSPGAHVVVRSVPGKPPPLETLLDAAQLALYFSIPEHHRNQPGRGAAADVDYTPVKHVRKPRGAKPGLVLLATHKTLRVRLEPERIGRLLASGAPSEG
ncbi:MAG: NFACT family protein [Planctomycetes bacterium]|nr:NFACT family protein [Planctomycetota bacterium]